jgi:hypothetical protein
MLGPEEWPSRQQWRTEFGLQVRLLQVLIFNHLQNTGSRCDAGVTQLRPSARKSQSSFAVPGPETTRLGPTGMDDAEVLRY